MRLKTFARRLGIRPITCTSLGVGFARVGSYFYIIYSLDNQMKVHIVLLCTTVIFTAVSYDVFNSHYIALVSVYILKRKSFATVLHPFFLHYGPYEDILMIISYVPGQ